MSLVVMAVTVGHDLSEFFIAGEYAIQRLEFAQGLRPQGLSLMLGDERAEPFPQSPRLSRHSVELTGDGAILKASQYVGRNQTGSSQPSQKVLARGDPFHRRVNRGRDRIEEIKAEGIGNEESSGTTLCHVLRPVGRLKASSLTDMFRK
jgi:hypothetical protein